MAHHQRKQPEEARRALDEASKILVRTQGDADARSYHDELIAQVLYREALNLIEGYREIMLVV